MNQAAHKAHMHFSNSNLKHKAQNIKINDQIGTGSTRTALIYDFISPSERV